MTEGEGATAWALVPTDEFRRAVELASKGTGRSSSMPILAGIHLSSGTDKDAGPILTVEATDLDVAIALDIHVRVQGRLDAIVWAGQLLSFLKSVKERGGEVEITQEAQGVRVRYGTREVLLSPMPREDWPEMPFERQNGEPCHANVDAEWFVRFLKHIMPVYTKTGIDRAVYRAVGLQARDGRLVGTVTNGRALARDAMEIMEIKGASPGDELKSGILVYAPGLSRLLPVLTKALSWNSMFSLSLAADKGSLIIGGTFVRLAVRLIRDWEWEDEPVDCDSLIKAQEEESRHRVSCQVDELVNALGAASGVSSTSDFILSYGPFTVRAEDRSAGTVLETIVQCEGRTAQVAGRQYRYKIEYLLDILEPWSKGLNTVELRFPDDGEMPLLITIRGNQDFGALVMPL